MVTIRYCSHAAMKPAFGKADPAARTIYVNQDLPGPVRDFVIRHELLHLDQKPGHWLRRELHANIHAGLRHPMGFLLCLAMSLQPYRLKFYWQRFKEGR